MKLGYNELDYNEHSGITNKIFSPKRPFDYKNQSDYNEPSCNEPILILSIPSCSL